MLYFQIVPNLLKSWEEKIMRIVGVDYEDSLSGMV